jgi:hypothetical protein
MDGFHGLAAFLHTNAATGATNWPEAVIAASAILAGVAMITAIVVVLVWQGLGTWRARMQTAREQAYQRLSEEMAENLRSSSEQLKRMAEELEDMRTRTAEIERLLKEV